MGLRIVLTGPATDSKGKTIFRAALIAACQNVDIEVQDQIEGNTHLLVASRTDTVKAQEAAAKGITVLTYPQFLEDFLPTGVHNQDFKPNSWTDKPKKAPKPDPNAPFIDVL